MLDLRRNLISVGQLDDEWHAILFIGGAWKVTKGGRVLAHGKKTGTQETQLQLLMQVLI